MATTDPAAAGGGVVISDAGPLIHLDELGCLDLLNDFARVLLPPAVWEEVRHHRPGVFSHPPVAPLHRVDPPAPPDESIATLCRSLTLHRGEVEALQLALDAEPRFFLTDDAAARLAADSLGLRTHGTIGLLLRAIRRGQRTKTEVVAILRSLPAVSTLHIKPSFLQGVVQDLERPR